MSHVINVCYFVNMSIFCLVAHFLCDTCFQTDRNWKWEFLGLLAGLSRWDADPQLQLKTPNCRTSWRRKLGTARTERSVRLSRDSVTWSPVLCVWVPQCQLYQSINAKLLNWQNCIALLLGRETSKTKPSCSQVASDINFGHLDHKDCHCRGKSGAGCEWSVHPPDGIVCLSISNCRAQTKEILWLNWCGCFLFHFSCRLKRT